MWDAYSHISAPCSYSKHFPIVFLSSTPKHFRVMNLIDFTSNVLVYNNAGADTEIIQRAKQNNKYFSILIFLLFLCHFSLPALLSQVNFNPACL